MTKVSLELNQALNQRLKAYCAKRYPDSYGHQQEVIREALTAFLDEQEKPKAAPKVYGMPHDGESTAKEKPIVETQKETTERRSLVKDKVATAKIKEMLAKGITSPTEMENAIGYPESTIRGYLTRNKLV